MVSSCNAQFKISNTENCIETFQYPFMRYSRCRNNFRTQVSLIESLAIKCRFTNESDQIQLNIKGSNCPVHAVVNRK